jgi:hypothetical protein
MNLTWLDGGYAHGRENIYLITSIPGGELRLTRWRRTESALPRLVVLVARQAARNAIVVSGTGQARSIASRFEGGEDIPGIAAWQHQTAQPGPEQETST